MLGIWSGISARKSAKFLTQVSMCVYVTMCVNVCVCAFVGEQLGSEMCRCLCMHACVCYY